MGYFDIDYNASAWQNLPVRLRQAVMYAWCKVVVSPVIYLAGLFAVNRNANLYNLAHNGQVCYLTAVLNDTFDSTLRRIYISDPAYIDPLFIYLEDELKPVWVGLESEVGSTPYPDPQWVYLESEVYTGGGVQFVVNVPAAILNVPYMKAVINKYRLASKSNYSIVTF